jgi:hypothetical protein
MTVWTFSGRVLPERFSLSVPEFTLESESEDFDVRYRLVVNFLESEITAVATILSGQTDVHTLKNLVENDLRFATDLFGYAAGAGLRPRRNFGNL